MTPQISKEAMEKARELTKTAHVHVASQDDRDRCAKCGENFRSHLSVNETLESRIALAFDTYQKRVEELEKIKEFMKTDLKPILAAALKAGAEFRIKSKFSPETLIISTETIDEFEEISFDPDWIKTAEESGTVVCTSRKE